MGAFPTLAGRSTSELIANNTRTVFGNGSTEIPVPGLNALHGVRIGETNIPLDHTIEVPDPRSPKDRTVHLPCPLVQLTVSPDGENVLQRSIVSNSGVWQSGVPVYVQGDWAPAPAAGK